MSMMIMTEEGMMLVMMVVMCKYRFVICVVQICQMVMCKYRFFLIVVMCKYKFVISVVQIWVKYRFDWYCADVLRSSPLSILNIR